MERAWSRIFPKLYQRRVELLAISIQMTGFPIGLLTDLGGVALIYGATGLVISELLGSTGFLNQRVVR